MNDRGGGGRSAASRRLCAAETRSGVEFLIAVKPDVVDARFAGLNTIHYLLEVLVFEL